MSFLTFMLLLSAIFTLLIAGLVLVIRGVLLQRKADREASKSRLP